MKYFGSKKKKERKKCMYTHNIIEKCECMQEAQMGGERGGGVRTAFIKVFNEKVFSCRKAIIYTHVERQAPF